MAVPPLGSSRANSSVCLIVAIETLSFLGFAHAMRKKIGVRSFSPLGDDLARPVMDYSTMG
jgi:hypothetical protein